MSADTFDYDEEKYRQIEAEYASRTHPCQRGENGEGECVMCFMCFERFGHEYEYDPNCRDCNGTGCNAASHREND